MLKRTLHKIFHLGINRLQWMVQFIFGVDKKKVVFISFSGKAYSDNPKAISEKLNEMDSTYKIIWLFNNPDIKKKIVPKYVKSVKNHSLFSLYELATAKFWIDNFNKPLFLYKSGKQCYIQTWHGDRAIKRILYDAWPNGKRPQPLFEEDKCDLLVTGSLFAEKMYSSAIRYSGKYLKVGAPRNDKLIRKNSINIQGIKNRIGVPFTSSILLYAPTFRKETSSSGFSQKIQDINLLKVIHVLEETTNRKWICLVRSHSAVNGLEGFPQTDKIIDCSSYEDMADLLLITDILITDYSSSATDFILTEKPVFLYQSDIQEYLVKDRTFYYDIEKTGFLVSYSMEELINIIKSLDFKYYSNERIRNFYGTYETGEASDKTVRFIIQQ